MTERNVILNGPYSEYQSCTLPTFHQPHTYTGTHYQFSSDDIAKMMSEANKLIEKALSIPLPPPPPLLRSSTWLSQLTDIWLIHTLHRYSVQGKHVVSVRVGV